MSDVPLHTRVLVIDDDEKLLTLLSEYLPRFQIGVLTASSAKKGVSMLDTEKPNLVVLDVLMPDMDGFDTCRAIRKRGDTPILMLSARGEAMDRIVGLELGADDYMAKPFEPRELVTRINAILRRSEGKPRNEIARSGELEIRSSEREAYLSGRALELTSMEYELLLLLARNPLKKFSRDEIMNHLQGIDAGGYSRSVDILVSRLRSKLGDDARSARFIKSIHGFGYVFIGEMT
jgi:DNA-binding response OmpR family regulator